MTIPVENVVVSVDRTFVFIFGSSALILVLIACALVYFVWKYDRKRHPVPAEFDGNLTAEIIWTVLPTILVMAMFAYGWSSFTALRGVPEGAMTVKVTARMWSWSFEYPDGKKSKELVVPVGAPVKLLLTSTDVIHGFFAPAFRIKMDTVPGMTTYAWFQPEKEGVHDIFCSVYCGLHHANMLTHIRAVTPEAFAAWLAEAPAAGLDGRALLDKYGCLGCHSLDGAASMGPTFKDIKGRGTILVAPDGKESTVTADEAYLLKAVQGDKGGVVKGFDPLMPVFTGQIPEPELNAMVRFLLTGEAAAGPDGAALAEREGCLGCHSIDGSALVGPTFKGLFGGKTTVVQHGHDQQVLVDQDYVLEVLADPQKRPTKGYEPMMPAYPNLSPEEKQALVQYLKSLAGAGQ